MSFYHFITAGHFAPGAIEQGACEFSRPLDADAVRAVLARFEDVEVEVTPTFVRAPLYVPGGEVRGVRELMRALAEATGCELADLEHRGRTTLAGGPELRLVDPSPRRTPRQ